MQNKYTIQQGKEIDRKQSNTVAMLNNPNIGFFCERGSSFVEMNLKHNIFLLVETNTLNGFVSGFFMLRQGCKKCFENCNVKY